MASKNREIIPMDKATPAELILAAKSCGLDELNTFQFLFSDKAMSMLTTQPALRQKVYSKLADFGYTLIRINPIKRLLDPNVMVPFDIAQPVRASNKGN